MCMEVIQVTMASFTWENCCNWIVYVTNDLPDGSYSIVINSSHKWKKLGMHSAPLQQKCPHPLKHEHSLLEREGWLDQLPPLTPLLDPHVYCDQFGNSNTECMWSAGTKPDDRDRKPLPVHLLRPRNIPIRDQIEIKFCVRFMMNWQSLGRTILHTLYAMSHCSELIVYILSHALLIMYGWYDCACPSPVPPRTNFSKSIYCVHTNLGVFII